MVDSGVRMTKRFKPAVLEAERAYSVKVDVAEGRTLFAFEDDAAEPQPLFFRKAAYMLPSYVVQAPMPTMTVRHLEKGILHLSSGKQDQALLAFRRAVASAIEPMTMIKVALACHTEGYRDEAAMALRRAQRYAEFDPRSRALVAAIAQNLNYDLLAATGPLPALGTAPLG